jgi:hypothetical protein
MRAVWLSLHTLLPLQLLDWSCVAIYTSNVVHDEAHLHDVLQLLQLLRCGVAAVLYRKASQAGQLLLLQHCCNGGPVAGCAAADMHLLQVAAWQDSK